MDVSHPTGTGNWALGCLNKHPVLLTSVPCLHARPTAVSCDRVLYIPSCPRTHHSLYVATENFGLPDLPGSSSWTRVCGATKPGLCGSEDGTWNVMSVRQALTWATSSALENIFEETNPTTSGSGGRWEELGRALDASWVLRFVICLCTLGGLPSKASLLCIEKQTNYIHPFTQLFRFLARRNTQTRKDNTRMMGCPNGKILEATCVLIPGKLLK